ncbi:MAG: glycoside hydrolase family 9 protein [Victivallaceae bacterium]|jgi:hypothetical protein
MQKIILPVLFFCFAVSGFCGDRQKDLIAWYKLDGNFNDSSGNNYHLKSLSPNNQFSPDSTVLPENNSCFGPVIPDDKKGGASGPVLPLSNKTGFTICGFVCKPDAGNDYHSADFGCGSSQHRKPAALFFSPWGTIYTKVGTTIDRKYQRLDDNRWHHYAMTVPAERENNEYRVYIDGIEVYRSPLQRLDSYGNFVLGITEGKQAAGLRIDEVKVFKRALAPDEIKEEAKLRGTPQPASSNPVALTVAKPGIGNAIDFVRRKKPKELNFPIKGSLAVHFITNQWICIVGDYNEFLCGRFKIECGDFLKRLDSGDIRVARWSYDFHYNFAALEVISEYRPIIKRNFEDVNNFQLSGGNGEPLKIIDNSYWINAVGQMRVPIIATGEETKVNSAAVAHFAYLKLAEPLKNGTRYTVKTRQGEETSFVYDENTIISQAIKVNQVGYLPDAGRKYAYLGAWLGPLGPLDLSNFAGQMFYMVDEATGGNAFSGQIKLRMKEQYYTGSRNEIVPLNGEDVYEMDFSKFTTPGKYHIMIPGVGRSWSFEIGGDAVGMAFYTHTRGLFHQRSGIRKGPPQTNWLMNPDHMESWVGGFSPNAGDYDTENKQGYGYTDENGKPVSLEHFNVIRETATSTKLPDVHGGWWDAADYDRRSYHFRIVEDLLTAYLMFPAKFSDGQLDIPESGNGIPDIIDEAAWGIELWRRAQTSKGGVGCWLEADSHPKFINPATDTQRYYVGLPTRWGTIQYASYSAMLARAYKQCGALEKADLYFKSSEKAFEYAVNPENTVKFSWKHMTDDKKYVEYKYSESPQISRIELFKAALNLYLYTSDGKYKAYLSQHAFESALQETEYPRTPFFLMELFLAQDLFPHFARIYSAEMLRQADQWLDNQNALAYRNLNWPTNHAYFRDLSWGGAIPFNKGRYFIAAYRITGNKKYRDAALLLNDWLCGANPMGRSLTTGLGKNYPVRLLSIPSDTDGILEPLPGISLYTYTFNVHYNAKTMIYALRYEPRRDHDFPGLNICLMPESIAKGRNMEIDEMTAAMNKFYPVWRRFANIEGYAVEQNEFTVWETISPCAACLGCLLPDGWRPPAEWKNRKPAEHLSEMNGYLFQP